MSPVDFGPAPLATNGREDLLRNGGNATYRESVPRYLVGTTQITSSGVGHVTHLPLFEGDLITSLSFGAQTGLTRGSTGGTAHLFAALYDRSSNLISQSTDEGDTSAWATGTTKTFTLSTPYRVTASGIYYAMVVCVAGTGGSPVQPTFRAIAGTGSPIVSGVLSGQPHLGGTSGSSLTTTAPGTISPAAGNIPYCVAS